MILPRRSAAAYAPGDVERAVREHAPLVRRIAAQVASRLPSSVERDDLVQEGMTGLLDALRRYVPQDGLSFEAYARTRIRGAIYDALRREDLLPRHRRDRLKHVQATVHALQHELGRDAEDAEIAEAAGLSLDEYHALLEDGASVTLVDELAEDEHPIDERADPLRAAELARLGARVRELLPRLPEREQLVLALHYVEDLSYREVARVLDLTAGRICQLHTQAMLRLRGWIEGEGAGQARVDTREPAAVPMPPPEP
jgi:RNA polymerase sigma factor for flagellar operon FliA